MALLTTGIIENSAVMGVRPSTTLTVKISNDDTAPASVEINGYYVSGLTKIQYVKELLSVPAGGVASRIYYAQFDAFEFQFTVTSPGVEISAWGKDAAGNLTTAQRVVPQELNPF